MNLFSTAPTEDPRFYQIAFQAGFLIFGSWALGWDQEWTRILVLMTVSLITQSIFVMLKQCQWNSLRSAAITGLGLGLLLRSN
jgi:hypothetical protein